MNNHTNSSSNTPPDNATTAPKESELKRTLKETMARQAIEGEAPQSFNFSLRKILGGDFLTARFIRSQIWLIVLLVIFIVVYISNRYNIQQDMIQIDALQQVLQDKKYKALSGRSQITEKSRESNVLKILQTNKDSMLHHATQPPYIIKVPENE